MKRTSFILVIFIMITALTAGSLHAAQPGLPYMTIDEFTEKYPQQIPLMQDFNELVSGPAPLIDRTSNRLVRIAFIYPTQQVSDYWLRSIDSFKKRMTEAGVPYIIDEYYSKPSQDQHLQDRQIRQALRNDPDYLIFTLDVFKHIELVDELLERGRPKVILQNITTPLRDWEGRQPFMYVGFDHTIGTKMLADYFIKKTGGTGNYGMLYFTHGYVSSMRGDMFRQYATAGSQLKQVDSEYTLGKTDRAEEAASDMLSDNSLKFLYSCSTDISLGAVQAIKKAGKTGKVLINGWGGGSAELNAIKAGRLDVTVMRMNDDNGVAMAEAIRLDLEGKPERVPNIFSGEIILIEKGISQEALNKLVKRAFRYSGN